MDSRLFWSNGNWIPGGEVSKEGTRGDEKFGLDKKRTRGCRWNVISLESRSKFGVKWCRERLRCQICCEIVQTFLEILYTCTWSCVQIDAHIIFDINSIETIDSAI